MKFLLKRKKELKERRRLRNPEIVQQKSKILHGSHHSTVLGDWYYSPRVQARLELQKKLLVEVLEDEINSSVNMKQAELMNNNLLHNHNNEVTKIKNEYALLKRV